MPKREMRLVPTQPVVRWHHRDSALANGTAREAGRPGAPAAYAPGALRRLFGAAQPPARGYHPHASPAGDGGRGAGHRVATLELDTTAEAGVCVCKRNGLRPLILTGKLYEPFERADGGRASHLALLRFSISAIKLMQH